MGIDPGKGRRAGVRTIVFLLALTTVILLCGTKPAHAADLRVVSGIVKSVSAAELNVNGRSYDIAGVPLRTGTGKPVSLADISPGTKVDLVFRAGKLRYVHVYPRNLVE